MKKIQKLANHFIKKILAQEENKNDPSLFETQTIEEYGEEIVGEERGEGIQSDEVKATVLESDLIALQRILDHMMKSSKVEDE